MDLEHRDRNLDKAVRSTVRHFMSQEYTDALMGMPNALKILNTHFDEIYGEGNEPSKIVDKWVTNITNMTTRPDFTDFFQQVYDANKMELDAYAEMTWQYWDTGNWVFSGSYGGHDLAVFLTANQ